MGISLFIFAPYIYLLPFPFPSLHPLYLRMTTTRAATPENIEAIVESIMSGETPEQWGVGINLLDIIYVEHRFSDTPSKNSTISLNEITQAMFNFYYKTIDDECWKEEDVMAQVIISAEEGLPTIILELYNNTVVKNTVYVLDRAAVKELITILADSQTIIYDCSEKPYFGY